MRPLALVGTILILLGVVGFIVKSVTYTINTSKVEVGPLEVTTAEKRTLDIPDIAAGVAVAAGTGG